MADDRPANDDLAAVVAELRRDLADLRGTALARAGRSPTGDIEPTIRTTPKPDTLLLQGQTLQRADYPVLWQWIVDQNLAPSVFGNGDESTTFALPDLRGRTLIGAGAGAGGTYDVGARGGSATVSLTVAQLASHTHTVTVDEETQRHTHGGTTNDENTGHSHGVGGAGGHGGHRSTNFTAQGGAQVTLADNLDRNHGHHDHGLTGGQNAFHRHNFATGGQDAFHSHTGSAASTGSGSPVDVRQPYIAVNWLLWT